MLVGDGKGVSRGNFQIYEFLEHHIGEENAMLAPLQDDLCLATISFAYILLILNY